MAQRHREDEVREDFGPGEDRNIGHRDKEKMRKKEKRKKLRSLKLLFLHNPVVYNLLCKPQNGNERNAHGFREKQA